MSRTKEIVAVGVILLFMGTALSPVIATTPTQVQNEIKTINNLSSQIKLAENDLVTMEKILPALMEKMKSATSLSDLVSTIQGFMVEHGRRPLLVLLLTLIIKTINLQFKIGQFRPVRKTAFIMSWGFTNKVLSLGKNKFNLARPFTMWYYGSRSSRIVNSRTIIFDVYPFSVKMVNGRQLGIMTNFIGLYLHFKGTIGDKMHTLFIGWAASIRAFDLSPFNP
jgi:hypothetical protein